MNVTNSTNDGVDKNPDGLPVSFTPRTLYILECVSLSLAVVSVVAAMIAFYWFVRMRRTFRQEYVPQSGLRPPARFTNKSSLQSHHAADTEVSPTPSHFCGFAIRELPMPSPEPGS